MQMIQITQIKMKVFMSYPFIQSQSQIYASDLNDEVTLGPLFWPKCPQVRYKTWYRKNSVKLYQK